MRKLKNYLRRLVITSWRLLGLIKPSEEIRILQTIGIDTVIDIGANEGQYGLYLRENGYRNNIYSVEPLPQPHLNLTLTA